MRRLVVLYWLLFFASEVSAQPIITTVAGGGPNNLPAIEANLASPAGVAVDGAGNFYVVAQGQHRVFRVDSGGTLTVVAGNGMLGFSGDGGPATDASLAFPFGVAVDGAGTVFIADGSNNRIRKVEPTGIISTVAGNGTFGFSGDGGLATGAALFSPFGVAVDGAGNLFIADLSNHRIRKVDPNGIISTVAGNGTFGFSGDGGPATNASLRSPVGVGVDEAGNLFIADLSNHRIRKVNPTGIIRTVAGNGTLGFSGDGGSATGASLRFPSGVAVDAAGNLFVADNGNNRIRKVDPTGMIITVAGNGTFGFSGDGGLATGAALFSPFGVAVDGAGNLFIADINNNRIRKVDPSGIIRTVAGNGMFGFSGDGLPASGASLRSPVGVGVDGAGNLFIADTTNKRIRKVDPSGIITTVAGNGTGGFSGDGGPATGASLFPTGVAVDAAGNLFIADEGNNRIRKVDRTGIITNVAGNGSRGFSGDGGPATSASLAQPFGVAVDGAGTLFIAGEGSRIRKVDPTGIISTVAGNGTFGFSGDGGPATGASLGSPTGVAVDGAGNLFIADIDNNRIRKVDRTGIISTVAGNGLCCFSGDGGPATGASLAAPFGVAVDGAGNLFIADSNNQRIRKVDPSGIITTVAGNGTFGFSGDGGPAISASLAFPFGVTADATGNLFIADTENNRVRKVTFDPATLITNLISTVTDLNLQQGIENGLDAKLEAARQALDDLNENNDVAAINALEAFVSFVEAQRGDKIPESDADALIAAAQAIIEILVG